MMFGKVRTQQDHKFVAPNLSAYLDGELSPRERARVARHLDVCATCRMDLETLQETVALLRGAPLRRVPRSFLLPATAQRVQRGYQHWGAAYSFFRVASVAVALVLVMLVSSDALLATRVLPAQKAVSVAKVVNVQPVAVELTMPAATVVQEVAVPPGAELPPTEEPRGGAGLGGGAEAFPEGTSDTGEQGGAVTTQSASVPPTAQPVAAAKMAPTQAQALAKGLAVAEATELPTGVANAAVAGGELPARKSLPTEAGVASTPDGLVAATAVQGAAVGGAVTWTATPTPLPPTPTAVPPTPTALPPTAAPTALPPTATLTPLLPTRTMRPSATPGQVAAAVTPEPFSGAEKADAAVEASPSRWWVVWQRVRILAGLLAGLLCILLAGVIWSAHERRI